MKNISSAIILASGLIALSSQAAFAQSFYDTRPQSYPDWYVGLQGAIAFVPDKNFSFTDTPFGPVQDEGVELSFDTGWAVMASLGYRPFAGPGVMNGIRTELEARYQNADVGEIEGSSALDEELGDLKTTSVMANLFYDLPFGYRYVTPYVGAGIGGAYHVTPSSEDTVVAYQFMTGLNFTPTDRSYPTWVLGYRYFTTEEAEFENRGYTFALDHESHNIEGGVRVNF